MRTFQYSGALVRVVDGDTVRVNIDVGFHVIVNATLRLARINAPERGQPGSKEAAAVLEEFIAADVFVVSHGKDRYGRYVADVVVKLGKVNLSDRLLELGYAAPYKEKT